MTTMNGASLERRRWREPGDVLGAGPELADHELRGASAHGGPRHRRVGGRLTPGLLRRLPAGPGRPACRGGLGAEQPDPGRGTRVRGGRRPADGGRDGGRAVAVDQQRLQPGGARIVRLRHGAGGVRDDAAGGAGWPGTYPGATGRVMAPRRLAAAVPGPTPST